jgi:PilZ domain-containing protein
MLESPAQTANAAERLRGGRRPGAAETPDDPEVRAFAAHVSSCLEKARVQQRDAAGERHEPPRAGQRPAKPQAAADGRRPQRVAGPFDGFRQGAIDTPVRIQDLSVSGCFVNSVHSAHHDGEVILKILLPNETWITVKAQIVRSVPGFGFGARFVDLPDSACEEITQLVAERGQS